MEFFKILKTPVETWDTIADADQETRQEIRAKCNGFITEITAGHQGKRLFAIWINPERTEAQQLHTLGHELAHLDRLHLERLTVEQAEAEARAAAAAYAERYSKGEFEQWEIF